MLHVTLLRPSCLVLAHAVLQIENGIALLTGLIFCRSIDQSMTPLARGLSIVVDAANLSVSHTLLRTVVVTLRTFRNLYAASFAVAAEECLGGRVDEIHTTDIHEVIMKAHRERVGDSIPCSIATALHIIFLAADIDDDTCSVIGAKTEVCPTLLVNLRELVARNRCLGDEGIGRNGDRQFLGINSKERCQQYECYQECLLVHCIISLLWLKSISSYQGRWNSCRRTPRRCRTWCA